MTMKGNKSSVFALLFAILCPVGFLLMLILPSSREIFQTATVAHPYLMGFIKFALLATTGEILAGKITTKAFAFPSGTLLKAFVWGVIGMMVALLFPIFSTGVAALQADAMILGGGSALLTAFLTSTINNLTFGISMMAGHRITDTMIERRGTGLSAWPTDAVNAIDWAGFVHFVVFRTIPLFWIPAHTVTFLLPPQYRVFLSAFLSIVLGLLLAIAKKSSMKKEAAR